MADFEFKKTHTKTQRLAESQRITTQYPDRVPIICEKLPGAKNIPDIDKKKYLAPGVLTIGQFMFVIRKRLKLSAEKALFIFIDNKIPSASQQLSEVYRTNKDLDGFLYVAYSFENTFGK